MGNPGQDSDVSAGGGDLTGMKERELVEDQGFGVSLGLPCINVLPLPLHVCSFS